MSQSKKEMMNRALSAMTMNIGKAGVNDNVIEEIKRQLKANEIVKLKFAKNIAKNKDDYIADIVDSGNLIWACATSPFFDEELMVKAKIAYEKALTRIMQ